jgi:tetratricopeptide (TPR) repeat protein
MTLCLALSALLLSCASLASKPRAIEETVKQAQSQVALGEYKKALALYAAADDKYGQDANLRRHYVMTGDRIRFAADTAFQQGVFSQAGGIYHILLTSGITGKNFQEPLSFDRAYLRSKIVSCSEALMELGLEKYRKDDLDGACCIWNKALAFDPGNRAVTKALQTTNKQRQMLKNIGATAK